MFQLAQRNFAHRLLLFFPAFLFSDKLIVDELAGE